MAQFRIFAAYGFLAASVLSLSLTSTVIAGELDLTLTDIRSAQGRVMVGLFSSAAAFAQEQHVAGQALPAQSGTLKALFSNLPAGRYSVAVYHDENGNGKLDTAYNGKPTEGVGFANNPDASRGVPVFESTTIPISVAGTTSATVAVRY